MQALVHRLTVPVGSRPGKMRRHEIAAANSLALNGSAEKVKEPRWRRLSRQAPRDASRDGSNRFSYSAPYLPPASFWGRDRGTPTVITGLS